MNTRKEIAKIRARLNLLDEFTDELHQHIVLENVRLDQVEHELKERKKNGRPQSGRSSPQPS